MDFDLEQTRKTVAELKRLQPDYAEEFDAILDNLENGARRMGRKGGIARAKKLTKRRRKEIAQKAARARWNKA